MKNRIDTEREGVLKQWVVHWLGLDGYAERLAQAEEKLQLRENNGLDQTVPADVMGEWLNGGEAR